MLGCWTTGGGPEGWAEAGKADRAAGRWGWTLGYYIQRKPACLPIASQIPFTLRTSTSQPLLTAQLSTLFLLLPLCPFPSRHSLSKQARCLSDRRLPLATHCGARPNRLVPTTLPCPPDFPSPDAHSLSEQARFPSDRRPLALHNVGLALAAFRSAGVPLDSIPTARGLAAVRAEDIVEGDRDRTLALLWAVARALQLPRLLRASTMKAEVARVLARGRMAGKGSGKDGKGGKGEVPLAVYMNDELACLLMEWVQAVCMQYRVGVANFTTCFGDGRVLCLLVSGIVFEGCGGEFVGC